MSELMLSLVVTWIRLLVILFTVLAAAHLWFAIRAVS
jgi:hypothetical protein